MVIQRQFVLSPHCVWHVTHFLYCICRVTCVKLKSWQILVYLTPNIRMNLSLESWFIPHALWMPYFVHCFMKNYSHAFHSPKLFWSSVQCSTHRPTSYVKPWLTTLSGLFLISKMPDKYWENMWIAKVKTWEPLVLRLQWRQRTLVCTVILRKDFKTCSI